MLPFTQHSHSRKGFKFLSPQVINKGLISYRDPVVAPGRGQKTLHVTRSMDLNKMVIRALRDMQVGAQGGSL